MYTQRKRRKSCHFEICIDFILKCCYLIVNSGFRKHFKWFNERHFEIVTDISNVNNGLRPEWGPERELFHRSLHVHSYQFSVILASFDHFEKIFSHLGSPIFTNVERNQANFCVTSDKRAWQSRLKKTETTKEMSRSATGQSWLNSDTGLDWFYPLLCCPSFRRYVFQTCFKVCGNGIRFTALTINHCKFASSLSQYSISLLFAKNESECVCVFICEKWETFIKSYPLLRTRSVLTNHIWYTL